jgi:hypothetical protein
LTDFRGQDIISGKKSNNGKPETRKTGKQAGEKHHGLSGNCKQSAGNAEAGGRE